MKLKTLLVIAILFCLYSCEYIQNSNKSVDSSKQSNITPILISDSTRGKYISVRDIGKLKQGEVVSIKFAIENGFEKALVINEVKTTCGCANVEYKPRPIKKGEKMVFDLTYNSQNRFGTQFANVIINSNFGEYIYRIEIFIENKN